MGWQAARWPATCGECGLTLLLALAEERIQEFKRKGMPPEGKTKWTATGEGGGVGLLDCARVRPDSLAGWRPLRVFAQRGHQE